ncbi:MAG: hypothetical protein WAW64_09720, partial [Gemmiger qucibialis]
DIFIFFLIFSNLFRKARNKTAERRFPLAYLLLLPFLSHKSVSFTSCAAPGCCQSELGAAEGS